MKKFEHLVHQHRGWPDDKLEAELTALGSDGWAVVAAYAVPEGATILRTHCYVMQREIVEEGEADISVTVAPGVELLRIVDEAKAAVAKSKGKGR